MKISTPKKVAVSFGLTFVLLLVAIYLSFSSLGGLSVNLEDNGRRLLAGQNVSEAVAALRSGRIHSQRYLLLQKRRDRDTHYAQMKKARQLLALVVSEEAADQTLRDQARQVLVFVESYQKELTKGMQTRDQQGLREAIQWVLTRKSEDLDEKIEQLAHSLILAANRSGLEDNRIVTDATNRTLEIMIAETILIMIVLIFTGGMIVRDVRTREQRQLALEKAESFAREASLAKTEFLSNMSHEIRTPMNAVMGMTQFLSETPLNEEQQEQVQIIRNSSNNLLRIINNVLDFSKIEAGKVEIEVTPVDLRKLATDVMTLLSPQAKHKGLSLNIAIPEDVPPKVMGDETRLRQVFINLVGNALKFTRQGAITLKVNKVEGKSGTYQLQVMDTGIGMSKEACAKIFEKFEQADTSTTRKYGGTGLGLSISQGLVGLMGGQIEVMSLVGVGTVFSFTLFLAHVPKVDAAATARLAEQKITAVQDRGIHKLLVVEDDAINQRISRKMLEKIGYIVDIAGTGKEALKKIKQESYTIVLMDCQMPEMDGYEATSRIRQGEAGNPNIPIVALTAHAFKEETDRCLKAGMSDFVTKPIDAGLLEAVVDRWVKVAVESRGKQA